MRIVSFPSPDSAPPPRDWQVLLDASLGGEASGPEAEAWRELRDDVRALAPPISPELAERLEREIVRLSASRPRRRVEKLASASQLRAVAAALIVCLIGVGVLVSHGSKTRSAPVSSPAVRATAGAAVMGSSSRVQQRGASVTLSTTAAGVQSLSDAVAALAVREQGFVASSHVQVQQQGPSEAGLTLSLPSVRLNAALAAISRLAPVRQESQSLQDITSSYEADRRRLSDLHAERQALRRALAGAHTEAQIAALRERLAQSGRALVAAESAFAADSRRASNAEVEVTILGDAHPQGEGLTLARGLHDAGRILVLAAVVLLIAGAVAVPAGLLLWLVLAARRARLRRSRERSLDAA
jgi:hypothetical protein